MRFQPAAEAAEAAVDLLTLLGYAAIGLACGIGVAIAVSIIAKIIAKRRQWVATFSRHVKRPFHVAMMVLGVWLGVLAFTTTSSGSDWRVLFRHIALLVFIATVAWFLVAVLQAVEDIVVAHHARHSSTSYSARVKTQMQVLRRVGSVIVVLCALGGMLLTFDSARAIGASVFASAGVISIVAGLAAQSSLTNMFAGMQIAFSDAIRVDDLVKIDGQLATIEEITLTYVVARTWDDRRIILPSTRFTTESFENWTRTETHLLGTVEFDLDWLVPVDALRAQLQRLVSATDLWDGRECSMQVTEATDGQIRVRAVVSATTSGNLWDLRCIVREALVDWLQANAPYALPRTRLEPEPATAPPLDDREEFNREMAQQWRAEVEKRRQQAHHDTLEQLRAGSADDAETRRRRQANAKKARRHAEKADKRAQKTSRARLGSSEWLEPVPSGDETQVLTAEEQKKLEAALQAGRLFGGSPAAERRAERMTGPSAADMEQRKAARARRQGMRDEEAGNTATMPAVIDPKPRADNDENQPEGQDRDEEK